MVTINGRGWATLGEAFRYSHGRDSYPRWPTTYGKTEDAPLASPEATGYYDAEREFQQRQDDREELS